MTTESNTLCTPKEFTFWRRKQGDSRPLYLYLVRDCPKFEKEFSMFYMNYEGEYCYETNRYFLRIFYKNFEMITPPANAELYTSGPQFDNAMRWRNAFKDAPFFDYEKGEYFNQ